MNIDHIEKKIPIDLQEIYTKLINATPEEKVKNKLRHEIDLQLSGRMNVKGKKKNYIILRWKGYEIMVSEKARVVKMTDGIYLKVVEKEFEGKKYKVLEEISKEKYHGMRYQDEEFNQILAES